MNSALKRMLENKPTLNIMGAAFGDEGKGKAISLVAQLYDIVARFAGGGNAGHTMFTADGRKIVGHQIPCGLAAGKICVLGRGELINLAAFFRELDEAAAVFGREHLPPIFVDEQAVLWTPWHSILESYLETKRGANRINTTGQGIGPMAALHRLRLGVLVGELLYDENFYLMHRLRQMFEALEPIFSDMVGKKILRPEQIPTPGKVAEMLFCHAEDLRSFVCDTSALLSEAIEDGQRVLVEGAQACGLDLMWGTYPFVSSTMATAAGAALGLGLPPQTFPNTLLVTKCMPTRVGAGPFPSEIGDRDEMQIFATTHKELFAAGEKRDVFLRETLARINAGTATPAETAQYFQVLGDERGATTGRGRSVGWLDIPWLQYACRINGPFGLALLRLDLLSGLKEIPVVTAYKLGDKILKAGVIPPPWRLHEVEPLIKRCPGWKENIAGAKTMRELPENAAHFLSFVDGSLPHYCDLLLVGTGPGEEDMIFRGV